MATTTRSFSFEEKWKQAKRNLPGRFTPISEMKPDRPAKPSPRRKNPLRRGVQPAEEPEPKRRR